jgi:type II secretory pathway predicted ATPase ExeA
MGAADTTDYIRQHLKFAGRSDPLFSDDAIQAIHLAVAALIATYAADRAIVDQAAAQLAIPENSE